MPQIENKKMSLATVFSRNALIALALIVNVTSMALPDVDRIEGSIVRVVVGGHGTGWVVSPGIVATNWHVTDGSSSFDIYPAGTEDHFQGELIWQGNSDLDIGLIRVPGLESTPFKLHTADAARGSDSYTVGFPGLGDDFTGLTNANVSVYGGTVALATENVAGVRIIQHTNIVNAGNSGGPLLDDCNRVLGLTTWGMESEGIQADFIWASMHVAELARQMDTLGLPYETDNSPCATGGASPAGEAALAELGLLQDQLGDQAGSMNSLEQMVRNWGLGLGAVLALTLALALRKPRQQLVRVYDEVSRRIGSSKSSSGSSVKRDASGAVQGSVASAVGGIVLSGFGADNKPIRMQFDSKLIEKSGKGFSVGRAAEMNDFVVADELISRRQMRVSYQDKKIMLEDLNSSNGTYLNGQLLPAFSPKELKVGDRIKIGAIEFSVASV